MGNLDRTKKYFACILALLLFAGGCGEAESPGNHSNPVQAVDLDEDGRNTQGGSEVQPGGSFSYEQPEMKGEITISAMFGQEFLTAAAESFMKEYPDVTVTIHVGIDNFSGTGGEEAIENYRTQLNTKIMSGKAEDIIFMTELPAQKYMDMGVFLDLSGYMESTGDMNEDNYFMNALTSARDEEGHLYILPYRLSFWTLGFDGRLADTGASIGRQGSIRFSEAAAYARQLADKSTLTNTFLTQENPMGYMQRLISEYWSSLVNVRERTADVNSDRYIGWLNEVKEMAEQGCFNMDSTFNYYNMEYCFAMEQDFDMQAAFYNLAADAPVCMMQPLADAEGNVYTGINNFFGINSASENSALAWEFMKYVLSSKIQSLPSLYGIAVNREGFEASVKRMLNFYTNASAVGVAEADYRNLLEQWVEQINKCDTVDPILLGFFYEENDKFFAGQQSAEQTAQAIQNKVTQYLNE